MAHTQRQIECTPYHKQERYNLRLQLRRLIQLFWLGLMCFYTSYTAASVSIDASTKQLNLYTHVSVMRIGDNLQLSHAVSSSMWHSPDNISPLEDQQALWGKLVINNAAAQTIDAYIVMANPGVNKLDWYLMDSKSRIRSSHFTGTDRVDELHPLQNGQFSLPVSFQPHEQLTLYFKLVDDGPMVLPLSLVSAEQWAKNQLLNKLITGFISGALLILSAYFMVAYVLRRSPVRFWFSASCLGAWLLLINLQGLLTQWLGLVPYLSSFTSGLLAFTLLCLVKVSHSVLQPVAAYWRYAAYALCSGLLLVSFILNAYWQLVFATSISSAILVIQLWLTFNAVRQGNKLAPRLFICGWLLICFVSIGQSSLFLNGIIVDNHINHIMLLLVLLGGLFIAFANDAAEQQARLSLYSEQTQVIEDLKQFYDLVQHTVDGLYVSSQDGQLLNVNPALVQLFGYESPQQMLSEVKTTEHLYRNQEDRQKLLKELHQHGFVINKEVQGSKRDGTEFWFSTSVQIKQDEGESLMYGSITDITERKHNHLSMAYLASHDPITGIYNHREFDRRLQHAMQYSRQNQSGLCLLIIAINDFARVNESCGYEAANILLRQLSHRLHQAISSRALLARLNNDQFAVLLEGELASDSLKIAEQLQSVGNQFRFMWEKRRFDLGLSIGIASSNLIGDTQQKLLSKASSACDSAKQKGRNQIHQYSDEGEEVTHFQTDQNWLTMLNQALEKDTFELYFQPYHPLKSTDSPAQYEILLRMKSDLQDNLISPSSFLPSAERHNLMAMIDAWVVKNYFEWLNQHPQQLESLSLCHINISGFSIADNELKLFLLNAFEQYQIPHHKICFELSETDAVTHLDETRKFIKTFANLGCKFALDDFGNEFSSYNTLKNLAVNFVKIDGGLIKDILIDAVDSAMVRSIQDISNTLNIQTIAEFVESKDIMVELGKLGVDYAQGYALSKPQPLNNLLTSLV
ncbi:EAL domain-containing protein [Neptunicella marina]|uniref:EAL domain-containing protein n=1 Tax=Neptunicella marina TaxID=2125989 RepID=A0A8J6LZB4_9ALTE|nr:EAL domain-containing protein [Neptunicella marina]MBC3766539.1 EAL domain-containing protein [Neptunicella marina]